MFDVSPPWRRVAKETRPIPKRSYPTKPPTERAVIAGVEVRGAYAPLALEESMDELEQLAGAAGAEVVGRVRQRRERASYTYMGRGKLQELADLAHATHADLVVLDDELSPAQQRVVEQAVNVKVIDRTALIIDIFSKRATSREGRLQVDLAQHEYLLPRLAGQWSHLERLGGGIGTRGPGETQIETDRRLIRGRISRLKGELERVRTHRAEHRRRRRKQGMLAVSLIGYTNAGKSTLFNALGHADTLVEDQLFATLDPVTRRARLPSGKDFLLTDTVGFIHKLPLTLVAAFRATLEELSEADMLLHVVDITHPNASSQSQVVEDTLRKMDLGHKPMVVALNKADLAFPEAQHERDIAELSGPLLAGLGRPDYPTALVSAVKGWGMTGLLSALDEALARATAPPGVIEGG